MLIQYQPQGSGASEIAANVESDITAGRVLPGTRVVSVRRTAAELGVSTATVAAAMAELRRRGLVVARPRSGMQIAERPPAVLVTARNHGQEIAAPLAAYRKVDEVRMIGKWFDVYRR